MKSLKTLISIGIIASATLSCFSKEKVSVLYVGGSPDIQVFGAMNVDTVAAQKSVKLRMADFEKFLKQRFNKVGVVEGKEYKPEMSAAYDVTVFDGNPEAITPRIMEEDGNGKLIRFEHASYLPYDFTDACVMIAERSEDLGRSLGSKNDWFCLCLDNYALGWQKDHPVFQGPFKVDVKAEMMPTPEHAKAYGPMYGYTLPDETEMWLVHRAVTPENNGRIGMVSRPWGYLDSPETEIISGGKCAKSIDAVAIGRDGNLFHWGYAAKPSDLTEAGRNVLANSIVYMKQFKGKHPIARKFNENVVTRDNADVQKYFTSRECWGMSYEEDLKFYHLIDSVRQSAKAKIARGEELSQAEMAYSEFPDNGKPVQKPYGEYVKSRVPKLYEVFGPDASEYERYYTVNRPYFYAEDGVNKYELLLDTEAKGLGIPNNDIRILEKAIELLEGDPDTEAPVGRTLLNRYTLLRYETPDEWKRWLANNRDRLFFSEAGGWLWLADTDDMYEPTNDYSVRKREQEEQRNALKKTTASPADQLATTKDQPVALKAECLTAPNGMKVIVVTMKIHEGFHAYADLDDEDPLIPTEVTVELPEELETAGEMVKPAAKPTANSTTHYTGLCTFVQPVSGKGSGEATVKITYQVCDDSTCQRPESKEFKVRI